MGGTPILSGILDGFGKIVNDAVRNSLDLPVPAKIDPPRSACSSVEISQVEKSPGSSLISFFELLFEPAALSPTPVPPGGGPR
jgi:hypothetical protein